MSVFICLYIFFLIIWLLGFPGGKQVEVRYVDFGNKKSLPVDDVCCIKEEFLALPAMVILLRKIKQFSHFLLFRYII